MSCGCRESFRIWTEGRAAPGARHLAMTTANLSESRSPARAQDSGIRAAEQVREPRPRGAQDRVRERQPRGAIVYAIYLLTEPDGDQKSAWMTTSPAIPRHRR
jgi:hypothetical protein